MRSRGHQQAEVLARSSRGMRPPALGRQPFSVRPTLPRRRRCTVRLVVFLYQRRTRRERSQSAQARLLRGRPGSARQRRERRLLPNGTRPVPTLLKSLRDA